MCIARALGESARTIMQPIVHVTRLPSICSLVETLTQAVDKVLNGIIDPGLHLQEIADGEELNDRLHDLRVHMFVAGAEDVLYAASIDKEVIHRVEVALKVLLACFNTSNRRLQPLGQGRGSGSYFAQEILPRVDLIDHFRVADADHVWAQPNSRAMTIMELPLCFLCVAGVDIQESPEISVLGPERTWDVFNRRCDEDPAGVQNQEAEKSLEDIKERDMLHPRANNGQWVDWTESECFQ